MNTFIYYNGLLQSSNHAHSPVSYFNFIDTPTTAFITFITYRIANLKYALIYAEV